MKIALITDTHYGARKGSKIFHEFFQKFYDDIFFPTLEERGIKVAVHLGDAFDSRKSIDFWALDWAKANVYDRFQELGIKLYNIVGNHDAYYKNTNNVNSVDCLLSQYKNVIPISESKEYKIGGANMLLVPWICQDNQDQTLDVLKKSKAKIVMGHLELNGFEAYKGQVMDHGHDPSIFKKFDLVYSGHYHTRSNDGKIFYLGNPYQMFWNDVDDKRGFHIFDTETHELEFVENPYTIFEKIYYEDNNYRTFNPLPYAGKIVKVIVRKKSSQADFEKFIDKIDKAGCVDLKVIENFAINDEEVSLSGDECEDTLTYLNKYIDDSDFDLDKDIIKNLMREVYREACEME